MRRSQPAAWAGLLAALLLASAAGAERAWVLGAPLQLRTGPSTEHRIQQALPPGAALEVLERREGWLRVRIEGGQEGWIPDGYVDAEAPADERAAALAEELSALRERVARADTERERLAAEHVRLSGAESEQVAEIQRLRRENARLAAGERWLEWVTGAALLAVGMALGALLARGSGRRRSRLRL